MKKLLRDYLPLIYAYLLTSFLTLLLSLYFSLNLLNSLTVFLGIFSLIFSIVKIVRINDFVEAFSEYDFLTQKFRIYGYLFPFFELLFGITFLLLVDNLYIEIFCLILFTLNLLSVLNALSKKRKFVCACLGDLIQVPLSKVSLLENITMILGSLILILN